MSRLRKTIQRIASSAPFSRLFASMLHYVDAPVLRLTGGRVAPSGLLIGVPVMLVTTVGAHSGHPRTLPLLATRDGERLILIASNWGGNKNPGWYYNLCAHPEARVIQNGQPVQYCAHESTGAEREACWRLAAQSYVGYETYKNRAGRRVIPVMVLEPSSIDR